MVSELVQPVLVLVVGYAIKFATKKLDIKLDDGAFHAIIFGIVAWLLSQLGLSAAVVAGLL